MFCPWCWTIFNNLPTCLTLGNYLQRWSDHLQTLNITENWRMVDKCWGKRTDGILGKITATGGIEQCKIVHSKSHTSLWKSKDKLFEKEVRRYQWRISLKTTAKKICVRFILFILYVVILWLVILARNQILWIIFLSLSALMIFIYFVFYRTAKFASNL